jgi:hypothetical protein
MAGWCVARHAVKHRRRRSKRSRQWVRAAVARLRATGVPNAEELAAAGNSGSARVASNARTRRRMVAALTPARGASALANA